MNEETYYHLLTDRFGFQDGESNSEYYLHSNIVNLIANNQKLMTEHDKGENYPN
jgi:hypothetical protein